MFLFSKSLTTWKKMKINEDKVCPCVCVCARACVRACVCVRASVCVSLASDSSETIEVIIIKLGTVTT